MDVTPYSLTISLTLAVVFSLVAIDLRAVEVARSVLDVPTNVVFDAAPSTYKRYLSAYQRQVNGAVVFLPLLWCASIVCPHEMLACVLGSVWLLCRIVFGHILRTSETSSEWASRLELSSLCLQIGLFMLGLFGACMALFSLFIDSRLSLSFVVSTALMALGLAVSVWYGKQVESTIKSGRDYHPSLSEVMLAAASGNR